MRRNPHIGSLHPYEDLMEPTEDDLTKLHDRTFVKQLEALGIAKSMIVARAAIVDFYKADGHIKRWIKEFKLDEDGHLRKLAPGLDS